MKTSLIVWSVVAFLLSMGALFWIIRGDQVSREEEKNVREQETKKLKDMAEGLSRQLEDVQKQNDDLRRTVEGWPQNAAGPQAGNKFAAEAAQAIAKAKTEGFLVRAHEVKSLIARLEKEASGWEPRVKDILTGESGKRLADNKAHVEQISILLDKERSSAEVAQSWSKQLKTLLEPVEAAVKSEDKFFAPTDNVIQAVEGLAKRTQLQLQDYERDRKVLETMVAESEKNPVGVKTALQAIQELIADQEKQRLTLIANAKQAALDEAAKKFAAAEEKRVQVIAELKLKQIGESTLAEKQQLEVFLEKMKSEREKKLLEARFETSIPDINRYLGPFVTKGYAQPKSGAVMERTAKLEPMSYTRLKAVGALEEGRPGLERLAHIGCAFANDRFKGNFPQHMGGEFGWQKLDVPFVQRAQALLKEFGPLMVEKGFLSP